MSTAAESWDLLLRPKSMVWFYKLSQVLYLLKHPPDTSASPTIMPASFFSSELKEALSELSFGISGCKLGPSSSSEAQAFVDLLEGIRLDIRLHVQGFEVSLLLSVVHIHIFVDAYSRCDRFVNLLRLSMYQLIPLSRVLTHS